MSGYSGNRTHDNNVYSAEVTQQAAYKAASSQAAVKAADIAFHRAVKASAKANGIGFDCNTQALVELGTGGV
ncbi:hypothetical protein [Bradyrhizobium neotropicale]|uniref:Uncharacterized protein n=1 Tax=Bradyrhizobium neotropicale TaxID=1497615 RepID=A0A176ZDK2_9BRAD|nr:hypothetical protein [Bradyrhizobium neotropicale]OAF17856.1 hypothetical protein AXW67_06970 [Bradyrhizobium neotropicale]